PENDFQQSFFTHYSQIGKVVLFFDALDHVPPVRIPKFCKLIADLMSEANLKRIYVCSRAYSLHKVDFQFDFEHYLLEGFDHFEAAAFVRNYFSAINNNNGNINAITHETINSIINTVNKETNFQFLIPFFLKSFTEYITNGNLLGNFNREVDN